MQLGMVGLGRMGANIVRRLMRDGHECVVFDVDPNTVKELEGEGATGSGSMEAFVQALEKPRVAWVMIPAAITGKIVNQLAELMEPGEQATMFFLDPAGNALEFKAFADLGQLFAK